MATVANRGKEAEKIFREALDRLNLKHHDFDFERLDDARSSSGKNSKPRTGDFIVYHAGRSWTIEVKQVNHAFRLPKTNFPLDQRARLRKRSLAGSLPVLFIYFTPVEKWRVVDPGILGTETTGSWDLERLPTRAEKLDDLLRLLYEVTNAYCAQ